MSLRKTPRECWGFSGGRPGCGGNWRAQLSRWATAVPASVEAAQRAQVEVQLLRGEPESLRHRVEDLLELHQREPDALDLLRRERALVHAADRLALEQLPHELHEREHEARDGPLHVV